MPRTVTVRVSVVVGIVLLVAGIGMYGYGTYETATSCPSLSGIDVQPARSVDQTVTDFSDLPRDQRALFLFAVNPGGAGSFTTTDEQLRAVADELPEHIRYNGTVYSVWDAHIDCIDATVTRPLGILLTAIGAVTLLGIGLTTVVRRR